MLTKNNNILFVTVAVFIAAIINYFLVTEYFAGFASNFKAIESPPKALFDILWLVCYIFFALGWEFFYVEECTSKGCNLKQIQHHFLIVLIINVAFNVALFPMRSYYLATFLNFVHVGYLLYLAVNTFPISKRAIWGLVPYTLISSFQLFILFKLAVNLFTGEQIFSF